MTSVARDNSKHPLTLKEMQVIPIAERHPHINEHQNPLSIKKIDRKAVEKRRLKEEEELRKHWRKITYFSILAIALLFIAVSLRHKFFEIADFAMSIDPSIENVTRWLREIIFLVSGH